MLLRATQLESHLSRGLQNLYVVTGDEPLLVMEAADGIRAAARRDGYTEREVLTAESGFNWSTLRMSGNSLSLFASRRVLEIRIPTGKPGNEGSQAIEDYCSSLPVDTLTLVVLPKLDKRSGQGSNWYKALEKCGVIVEAYPVELDALPRWIGERLARQGQSAKSEALSFLAQQVEGNLLAAHQEIQKLGLLYPKGELTLEQVMDAVLNVSRYDVFQLGDAMLAGDVSRVARILEGLEGEGNKPIPILGMLTWLIRGLAKAKFAMNNGADFMTAMRQANIWGDRQKLAKGALGRLSLGQLESILQHAAKIDRMSKGLGKGDPWDELMQLCLTVARPGRPAKVNS